MIKLEDIIGLPPAGRLTSNDTLKLNTMPILDITPCTPAMGTAINLYTLQSARRGGDDNFDAKLENLGFSVNDPIRLAFQAESFPSDTFANEYGETFLNRMTDIASEGMSELMQMTSTKTGTEAIDKLAKTAEGWGGIAGSIGSFVGQKNAQMKQWLKEEKSGGAQLANKLIAGQRIDFPQIWKNSAFNVSYSVTIKLYNPKPSDDDAHEKFILGPLSLILLLASPMSDETGESYRWPYFHRIECPGLFKIQAGAITNVTVTKGGDQGQVAWTQRVGQVDVRLDFINVYSSIISGGKEDLDRPTIKSYIQAMRDKNDIDYIYDLEEENVGLGATPGELFVNQETFTKTVAPNASDPYEADLERVLSEDRIKEEDIIDDANGKVPTAPVSDLRDRSMIIDEIAVDSGGSASTGDIAMKAAEERYYGGIQTDVTSSATREMTNSRQQAESQNDYQQIFNNASKMIKR